MPPSTAFDEAGGLRAAFRQEAEAAVENMLDLMRKEDLPVCDQIALIQNLARLLEERPPLRTLACLKGLPRLVYQVFAAQEMPYNQTKERAPIIEAVQGLIPHMPLKAEGVEALGIALKCKDLCVAPTVMQTVRDAAQTGRLGIEDFASLVDRALECPHKDLILPTFVDALGFYAARPGVNRQLVLRTLNVIRPHVPPDAHEAFRAVDDTYRRAPYQEELRRAQGDFDRLWQALEDAPRGPERA